MVQGNASGMPGKGALLGDWLRRRRSWRRAGERALGLVLSLALLVPSFAPLLAEATAGPGGAIGLFGTGEAVTLAPSGGPAGILVSASGSGYPSGVAPITWDGLTNVIGAAAPDPSGNFLATFPIPRDADLGPHTITIGATTKTFTIDPDLTGSLPSGAPSLSLTPDAGQAGVEVTSVGSNLGAAQPLQFRFNNPNQSLTVTAGTPTTTAGGGFSGVSFNVPTGLAPGAYAVSAIAAGSGRSATARFVRGVAIDVEPQTIGVRPGRVSSSVTVRVRSGAQLMDGAEVHYTFNTGQLEVVDTDPIAAGVQVTPGTVFQQPLPGGADNTAGTLDIGATRSLAQNPIPSGTITLATFQFKGKAEGASALTSTFAEAALEAVKYDLVVSLPRVIVRTPVFGPPAQIAAVGAVSQSGQVGTTLTGPFTVKVTDAEGRAVENATVTWAIASQPAGAAGQSLTTVAVTDDLGQSTAVLKLGAKSGAYTVTATLGAITGSPVTFTGTATPGPAVKLAFLSQPAAATEGIAFAPQPVVAVQDADGNTVTNSSAAIALTVQPNAAGGALACTPATVNAAAGVAAFTNCFIDKAGLGYALSASAASLAGAAGTPFDVAIRSGNVWGPQTSGVAQDLFGVSAANLGVVWAAGAAGTIVKTVNGGLSWTPQNSGVVSRLNAVSAAGASNAWAVGDSGVIRYTADGGANWSAQTGAGTARLTGVAAAGSTTAWTVGDGGLVLKTVNSGGAWIPQSSNTPANLAAVSAVDPATAWAVGAGGVIIKTSDGTNWTAQPSGVTENLTGISAANASTAWAAGEGGTILRTTNGGASWTKQTSGVTSALRAVSAATVTVAYAVGDGGVILRTADSGSSWLPQPSGVTTALRAVTAKGANAWAAGDAGVILQTSTASIAFGAGNGQQATVTTALPNAFSVSVTDAFGASPAGMPVTWSVSSAPSGAAGQTMTPVLSFTDAAGGASALLTLGSKSGVYVVAASSPGLAGSPVTFTAEARPGAATVLSVVSPAGPADGVVGTLLGQQLVASAQDAHQNPTPGVTLTFTVAEAPSGASGHDLNQIITGAQTTVTAITDANGRGAASFTLGNRPGAYRVDVTSGALAKVTFTVNAANGPAANLRIVSGEGQNQGAGTTLARAFVVGVQDAQGNPAPGVDVKFEIVAAPLNAVNQGLSFTTVTTNNIGVAATTLALGNLAGEYRVEASVGALPKVTFIATAIDTTARRMVFHTGSPQSGATGQALSQSFAAKVFNASGTPQSGVSVAFAVTGKPAGATGESLSLAAAVTDSLGVAASVFTLGDLPSVQPNDYQVTATCTACTSAGEKTVVFTATATAPAPVSIVKSAGDGQFGITGRELERSFLVTVRDAEGKASPGATVAFAVTTRPALAVNDSLAVAAAATTAQGQAATKLTLGSRSGEYRVTATCTSCAGTPAVVFSATAAAGADRIVRISGDGQFGAASGTQNRSLKSPLVVEVQDALGNPLSGVPVAFETSLGTFSAAGAATDAAGRALARLNLGAAGLHTVTARCPGCLSAQSVTFSATALPVLALRGSVVGVDVLGRPLASPAVVGAGVTVSQIDLGLSFTGTTDANGDFNLPALAGAGSLAVSAAGFAPISNRAVGLNAAGVQSPAQGDLVIQAVEPGVTISGTVTRDAVPVVGAFVVGIEADPSTVANPQPSRGARSVSAFTDTNGVYTLAVPRNTFWKITATSIDIGSADLDLNKNEIPDIVAVGAANETSQNITFRTTVNLTGTVQADGAGIVGANVSAIQVGANPNPGNVTTIAGGAFTLPLAVPAVGTTTTFIVNVAAPELGELRPQSIGLNSAGRCLDDVTNAIPNVIPCQLTFAVTTNTITFNFLDAGGQPFIAGEAFIGAASSTTVAGQNAAAPANSLRVSGASSAQLRVLGGDAAGGLAETEYAVTARVTGLGLLAQTTLKVPPSRTVNVTVPATLTVLGKVTDTSGAVLVGAAVTLLTSGFTTSAVSADDGRFSASVPTQTALYQMIASKAGYLPSAQSVTVSSSMTVPDFRLVPAAGQNTISGTVDGPPSDVPVTVTASAADGRTISVGRGALGTNCDATKVPSQTAFCMTVGVGTWTVRASADGYAYASTNPASVDTTGGPASGVTVGMNAVASSNLQSQQCLDTNGCRAEAKGSRIIMIVPAGAAGNANQVVTITIKETTNAPESGAFTPGLVNAEGVPVALDFVILNSAGEAITQFSLPISFTIEGLGLGSIVGYYDDATGAWIPLASCTATATGVSCTTTHLTKFSILTAKNFGSSGGGGSTGGGGGWPPIIVGAPPVTAGTIDSGRGGSIATPRVWADLPPGVVTTSVQMTGRINEQPQGAPPEAPAGALLTTALFTVDLNNILGPRISDLDKAATINVRLTDADLALVCGDPSLLRFRRYDEATGQWVDLEIVNASTGVISAKTTHLSLFAIMAAVPAPGLSDPPDLSQVLGLDPILAWGQTCAKQYHVQVAAFNNDGPGLDLIIGEQQLVQSRRFPILPPRMGTGGYLLLPAMTYTWRVRTTPLTTALGPQDKGWSEFSAPRSFRTGAPTSATIRPVAPPDRAQSVSPAPRLQWTNDNARIFYYEVQLSEDPTFETDPARATAAVAWELVHGGQSVPLNSYPVKAQYTLTPGRTYYWRVRPRVQGDGKPVAWSDTWRFVVEGAAP